MSNFLERAGTHSVILFTTLAATYETPWVAGTTAAYFIGLESVNAFRKFRSEKKPLGNNRVVDVAINSRRIIH